MSHYNEPQTPAEEGGEFKKALIAAAVLIALFAALLFAPQRDPGRTVAGIPCSVLSENAIGAVVGTQVQLMPTNGTTCQYVATNTKAQKTVFVLARREPTPPSGIANDEGVRVDGVGDAALRMADALYVRTGSRWYGIVIVPRSSDGAQYADEVKLARMMSRSAVANR